MVENEPPRAPESAPASAGVAQWLWSTAAVGGALVVTLTMILVSTSGGEEDVWVYPSGATTATPTDRSAPATGPATAAARSATPPATAAARSAAPPAAPPAGMSAPAVTATARSATTTSPSPTTSNALLAVPVFYAAEVEGVGPRLYREVHRVEDRGNPVTSALAEMFTGSPRDPDYRSLWPASTRVLRVDAGSGGLVTVDLSNFVSAAVSFENAAVQQLVHTVSAADPTFTRVALRVNGKVPSAHLDWTRPVPRAPALGTLGAVWILGPEEGATVGSPVTITVHGAGWGGAVPLKVFVGSEEIASTSVTTTMGGFVQGQTRIALPPGTYELRAYNDDVGGASLRMWDTKRFTVR